MSGENTQAPSDAADDLTYWLDYPPTSNSDRYALEQAARAVLAELSAVRAERDALRAQAKARTAPTWNRKELKHAADAAEKSHDDYMLHREVGWVTLTAAQSIELRRRRITRDVLHAALAQTAPDATQ